MKSTAITCAIAAATLCFGSLACAQEYNHRSGDRQAREQGSSQRYGADQHARGGQRAARDDGRRWDGRQQGYAGQRDHRYDGGDGGRGFEARRPQFQQFHRGTPIPYPYRDQRYYVNDWRSHRLSAPPYGYQWVQDGSDYALIAMASGVIANLLINQ